MRQRTPRTARQEPRISRVQKIPVTTTKWNSDPRKGIFHTIRFSSRKMNLNTVISPSSCKSLLRTSTLRSTHRESLTIILIGRRASYTPSCPNNDSALCKSSVPAAEPPAPAPCKCSVPAAEPPPGESTIPPLEPPAAPEPSTPVPASTSPPFSRNLRTRRVRRIFERHAARRHASLTRASKKLKVVSKPEMQTLRMNVLDKRLIRRHRAIVDEIHRLLVDLALAHPESELPRILSNSAVRETQPKASVPEEAPTRFARIQTRRNNANTRIQLIRKLPSNLNRLRQQRMRTPEVVQKVRSPERNVSRWIRDEREERTLKFLLSVRRCHRHRLLDYLLLRNRSFITPDARRVQTAIVTTRPLSYRR